jgi:hypothetical protein
MLLFNDDGQISTLVQFDMQVSRMAVSHGSMTPSLSLIAASVAGVHCVQRAGALSEQQQQEEHKGCQCLEHPHSGDPACMRHLHRCVLHRLPPALACAVQDYSRLLRDNAPAGSK